MRSDRIRIGALNKLRYGYDQIKFGSIIFRVVSDMWVGLNGLSVLPYIIP
jgi:hypothetical protein